MSNEFDTENGFNHPCKKTCSGWKQGFDAGVNQCRGEIDKLLAENQKMRTALENYIEWLEAGYGGMFGHEATTPQEDAYSLIEKRIPLLKEALTFGEKVGE
jgi:hypothetical protein